MCLSRAADADVTAAGELNHKFKKKRSYFRKVSPSSGMKDDGHREKHTRECSFTRCNLLDAYYYFHRVEVETVQIYIDK